MQQQYLLEIIGTCILSLVAMHSKSAFAGGAVIVLFGIVWNTSLNPVITIAKMHLEQTARTDVMPLIISQIIGAIVGAELSKLL